MKKILTIILLASFSLCITTSCVRSKKSCKASHKRMKQMRKSGQLKM